MSTVPAATIPQAPKRMTAKPALLLVGVLALALALPWVFLAQRNAAAAAQLPVMGQLPSWSLTSHHNKPFGSQQLDGKPYLVSFFFTSCPSICPKIMKAMKRVHDRTAALELVSITVDPETDTPDVLQRSLDKYDAKGARWTLCTGTDAQIRAVVVDGFKTYVGKQLAKTADVYDIMHGSRLVLVDGKGQVRGHFSTDEAGLDELVEAAKTL